MSEKEICNLEGLVLINICVYKNSEEVYLSTILTDWGDYSISANDQIFLGLKIEASTLSHYRLDRSKKVLNHLWEVLKTPKRKLQKLQNKVQPPSQKRSASFVKKFMKSDVKEFQNPPGLNSSRIPGRHFL